jgi:hypothetical protein
MSSNTHSSEVTGTGPEMTGTGRTPLGTDPESVGAGRMGGVPVKEAAAHLGMPVSTMYDWVNRRWVRTVVGLSERGKEQRLVPWMEIERLKGGAKEQLLQESGRKLNTGSGSEPAGTGPEPVGAGSDATGTGSVPAVPVSEPAGTGSERAGDGSEPAGIDWKWVAKAESRRVRDLASRARFLEEQVAKAEQRAERAEDRAEREGRELRLLIAQSVQAQQQTAAALSGIEERMALPAPKRARWWTPWKR